MIVSIALPPGQAIILRRLSIVVWASPAEKNTPPDEEPPMTLRAQLGRRTWSQRVGPRSAGATPVVATRADATAWRAPASGSCTRHTNCGRKAG